MYSDKVLMITGGTGSFGQQVLKGALAKEFKEIIIISRDEEKQHTLRNKFRDERLNFIIGDVRDRDSMKSSISRANYIFHAAALKQVPSCEFFPLEALKTNVLGTANVLELAVAAGVERVVCLSTDKAAYPVNAMGISKAMMEKVALAKARECLQGTTKICVTRYGNVMNSRGSVIPLFIEKIAKKENLPITNPNMTRFMMTLSEALDLVMYAFDNAEGGEIFIQKSNAAKIDTLARALIRLYKSEVETYQIGMRHGEKMYEVLMTQEEAASSVDMGNYYKIVPDYRGLNYEKYLTEGDKKINNSKLYSSDNTYIMNEEEVIEKLKTVEGIML
jgi:UDP-glucose 4-epimerase